MSKAEIAYDAEGIVSDMGYLRQRFTITDIGACDGIILVVTSRDISDEALEIVQRHMSTNDWICWTDKPEELTWQVNLW